MHGNGTTESRLHIVHARINVSKSLRAPDPRMIYRHDGSIQIALIYVYSDKSRMVNNDNYTKTSNAK